MEKISIGHKGHAEVLASVVEFLAAEGYVVSDHGYERTMAPALVDSLGRCETPAAQVVRGRADLLAHHAKMASTFYADAKSKSEKTDKTDICLELIPLARAYNESMLGGDTLYCCHDSKLGREVGIWASDLPPIREIMMPRHLQFTEQGRHAIKVAKHVLGVTRISCFNPKTSDGSGDIFAVIDTKVADDLPDWRDCIKDRKSRGSGYGLAIKSMKARVNKIEAGVIADLQDEDWTVQKPAEKTL